MDSFISEKLYIFKRLSIIFLFGLMFFLASLGKWLDGEAPKWFIDQFSHTILSYMPQNFLYLSLAFFESLVAILAFSSLLSGEWYKEKTPLLKLTLFASLIIFLMLGFGARLSHKYQDSAFHFMYFCGTLFALFIIEHEEKKPRSSRILSA